jgi:1-acyl-sn-glycerol-3-phosphate acyltransferase
VIDVCIGEPIDSAGRNPDELMGDVKVWIEGKMRELDSEAYQKA